MGVNKTIVSPEPAKVISRVSECLRMLMEAGLTFDDLQKPIDNPVIRQRIVQFWRSGCITETHPQKTGLVFHKNGTVSLQVAIDYGQSIEQLVEKVKKAGWSIDDNFTMSRLDSARRAQKPDGMWMCDLVLTTRLSWPVSGSETAPFQNFGLYELVQFIPYCDELYTYGITLITALGDTFTYSQADGCLASLDFEKRKLWANHIPFIALGCCGRLES